MRSWLLHWSIVAGTMAGGLPGQVATPQDKVATPAEVQARLDAVAADKTIPTELAASLVEVLGKALESARATESTEAARRALPTPKQIADGLVEYRAAHEAAAGVELPKNSNLSLSEAELALAKAQKDEADSGKQITELEKEATRRATRRAEIPTELVDLRKELSALPNAVETKDVAPSLLEARRMRLRIDRHRLETQIAALQAESLSYDARDQLLTLRRDLAARTANNAKAVAEAWQRIVQEQRSAAATAAQEAARRAADSAREQHPMIRELAATNTEIASFLTPLAKKQRFVESLIGRARALEDRIQAQFTDVKKRAQGAGSTQSLGRMLRESRAKLPDASRVFRQHGGPDDTEEAESYLASIDWEQKRRALSDDPALLENLVQNARPVLTDPEALEELRTRGRELLGHRLEMLKTLSENSSKYVADLQALDASRRTVRELIAEYRTFVNERVLWIRSSAPVWGLEVSAVADALLWLVSPQAWWSAARSAWAVAVAEIWPLIALFLLTVLWLMRPIWNRQLAAQGEVASRGKNTRYLPTALALFWTLVLVLPLPALFLLASWSLANGFDASGFGKAMAVGVRHSAGSLAGLLGLAHIIRAGGLAEAHFRWRPKTLSVLRRNLWLLWPAVFPLSTALGALEKHGVDTWLGSLGRLLLLPLLALLTVFLWRVLHPSTGILATGHDRFLLGRMRRLWFTLGVGTTVALIVMTTLGYEYTAVQLARSLIYTVVIVIGGVLIHALVFHKLLLERRRLSIHQARERMQAARASAAEERSDGDIEPPEEESELDPSSIAEQTVALVRTTIVLSVLFAILQVWGEVLPALGVFREVSLWTDSGSEPPIQITLADMMVALVIVLVTIVAARNIPGLLELLVLRRLRMQAGERHATTTLARYVLVVVGTVMAFSSIGLGWSKVQWLVAAVSLGLGFGLQEIFANFVSGLILLFERPVRVGDWVLVGDVLGKVTRIKIRATTVRDLDNKELVVPNKEFVTGRFVNWTLTDSLVRLHLLVGVAYGSDTEKAKQLLLQAAHESSHASKSPAPRALFLGFGDSTLNLELRVYVDDYQEHAVLLDDLHSRVDRLFRAAGVEIAFPQRDLHLRTAHPLVEVLDRSEAHG